MPTNTVTSIVASVAAVNARTANAPAKPSLAQPAAPAGRVLAGPEGEEHEEGPRGPRRGHAGEGAGAVTNGDAERDHGRRRGSALAGCGPRSAAEHPDDEQRERGPAGTHGRGRRRRSLHGQPARWRSAAGSGRDRQGWPEHAGAARGEVHAAWRKPAQCGPTNHRPERRGYSARPMRSAFALTTASSVPVEQRHALAAGVGIAALALLSEPPMELENIVRRVTIRGERVGGHRVASPSQTKCARTRRPRARRSQRGSRRTSACRACARARGELRRLERRPNTATAQASPRIASATSCCSMEAAPARH